MFSTLRVSVDPPQEEMGKKGALPSVGSGSTIPQANVIKKAGTKIEKRCIRVRGLLSTTNRVDLSVLVRLRVLITCRKRHSLRRSLRHRRDRAISSRSLPTKNGLFSGPLFLHAKLIFMKSMKSMKAQDLATLLRDDASDVILFDIRPPLSYQSAHIRQTCSLFIPSILLKRAFNVKEYLVKLNLSSDVQDRLNDQKHAMTIVFYEASYFKDPLLKMGPLASRIEQTFPWHHYFWLEEGVDTLLNITPNFQKSRMIQRLKPSQNSRFSDPS